MQNKAAFISEKGRDRIVRGKDLLDKIGLADDKYIEEASGYKKNSRARTVKISLIAAVAALAVLLPVMIVIAAKTTATAPYYGDPNSVSGDWPYYKTRRELENAATSIYDGVITDIFFKVLDMTTGEVITSAHEDKDGPYMLYTVYEVKVTRNYKNADTEKKYFCINGGKKGYKEDEQVQLLKSVGLYTEGTGVMISGHMPDLNIGETYKFYTVKSSGPYEYIVNPTQFAAAK